MTANPPIRLLRASNPSPLTGTGTNTWIVGASRLAVIDPGPDDVSHLGRILASVGPGQSIDQILVTHAHRDHSELAKALSRVTGAPVLAFGAAPEGRSPLMSDLAAKIPSHGEGLDTSFAPDKRLADQDRIAGPDWDMVVHHTPGHLGGHLCFALGDTLFSGDHVMGWSTTIVSPPDGDMQAYMTSLGRLTQLRWSRLLPGHGDEVTQPDQRIRDLIEHRQSRETQILQTLADRSDHIPGLTARIYRDIPNHLIPAAERNVFAHLIDLSERKLVAADPSIHPDARYSLR